MITIEKNQIQYLLDAITKDSKYVPQGILFEQDDKMEGYTGIIAITLDGRKMHRIDIPVDNSSNPFYIACKKGLILSVEGIIDYLKSAEQVKVSVDNGITIIPKNKKKKPFTVEFEKLKSKFPNWRMFIPKEKPSYRIKLDARLLNPKYQYIMEFYKTGREPIKCKVFDNEDYIGSAIIMPKEIEDESSGLLEK